MIPKRMHKFLTNVLTKQAWEENLITQGSLRFMEFRFFDIDHLYSLGITVDSLGPYVVVCMWDEESPIEIGGYLVVDNLSMGKPAMGGIRLALDITPLTIHNLARGMTLKNAAAGLSYGGGKAGIVASQGLSKEEHEEVIKGFAHLLYYYKDIYNPGPDVGTNDADMKTIATENGLDNTLSKPEEMGGTCIDLFGGAAGGVVTALKTVMGELDKLKKFPQFHDLKIPRLKDVTILIQGFGAVGANVAKILTRGDVSKIPLVVGISDKDGYLYSGEGLPIDKLFDLWEQHKTAVKLFVEEDKLYISDATGITYSNNCNNLLRESAFCFIPAAPVSNYLDVDKSSNPSITIDEMGKWSVVVEGANTYSPAPEIKSRRLRMERAVYRDKGVLFIPDYLVNSGGVIFAAQERYIPTPEHLQIPQHYLGNKEKVEEWLDKNTNEFKKLSNKRAEAGIKMRDEEIRHNIIEFINLLSQDANMLPSDAAEKISISRIASSEKKRTIGEIMCEISTVKENSSVHDAAKVLLESESDIIAVVSDEGKLVGVVTDWDITHALSDKTLYDTKLRSIMSSNVVTVNPKDHILDSIRKLELNGISAMPVVEGDRAVGVISSDIFTRHTLPRLLQNDI
jgi:glutamate dehydrogenase/leucine dehydrogenase